MFRRRPDVQHAPDRTVPSVLAAVRVLRASLDVTAVSRPGHLDLRGHRRGLRVVVQAEHRSIIVSVSDRDDPLIYAHVVQQIGMSDRDILERRPADVHTSGNILTAEQAARTGTCLDIGARVAAALNRHAGPIS